MRSGPRHNDGGQIEQAEGTGSRDTEQSWWPEGYKPAEQYLWHLRSTLSALDTLDIQRVVEALLDVYHHARTVFILGNGGSASTASHFACDLGKNTVASGSRRFRVLALTDNVAMLTAWANDASYDRVFAEQLENLVKPDDLVIAISGSGNSPNVLRAMETARHHGASTVGLIGFEGGSLKPLCDMTVVVPCDRMDQIEDVHLAIQHLICRILREELSRGASTAQRSTGSQTVSQGVDR